MSNISLALITGIDIPIPECSVVLHQPTIEEISFLGEEEFLSGVNCLCVDKDNFVQDENAEVIANINNFQLLMMIIEQDKSHKIRQNMQSTLKLMFPAYQIVFTPRAIMLNNNGESFIVDERNFESLQLICRQVFCVHKTDGDKFNPQGAKAKEIAQKLLKARKRVAELKAQENPCSSVLGQHISVLAVGLHSMSLKDLIHCTIFQIYDLMERFGLYTGYDMDMRARLAGADIKQDPENWMKPIH